MKILCEFTPAGPAYVRSGWGRVFSHLGHDFRFWDPEKKPAFDVFSEFEPDVFLGTTYGADRAVCKCIAARPHMKVAMFASAWGPYLNDVDLKKYPLVVTTDNEKKNIEALRSTCGKPDFVFIHAHGRWLDGTMSGWNEIGVPYLGVLNAADLFQYTGGKRRPELVSDIFFCGGRWGYKAENIDRFLLPLCHPSSGLNVKIFGSGGWPVPQWLGACTDEDVRDGFVSATVCPNVSEPHSTRYGWDLVERPYKILAAGGFCISDYVEEGRDLFTEKELIMEADPDCWRDRIRHYVKNPDERIGFIEAGRKKVLAEHTYFDRVATILEGMGLAGEADRARRAKLEFLEKLT